ncbi:(d)CMP kinase [Candidatus Undinarchaeota archaeon]
MRITLSGPPGSGTTTVGKIVAKKLNIDFVPASLIFRQMAEIKGVSLLEFNKMCESDPECDKEMDFAQKEYMNKDNFVIDSRLSWYFIENADFRVHIDADISERARRAASRDNLSQEDALEKIKEREESEKRRYLDYYGIDITDMSVYDLVVNSTTTPAKEVAEMIVNKIQDKEV